MTETQIACVPRIRVARARDVPKGAVRVFGAVLWRNPYGYRSRNGLARVPAAQGVGEWEYEDRISSAGMRHDFWHPEGHEPPISVCHVRYMTRRECQEIYRRVLTGEVWGPLEHHRLKVSVPEVVEALKGRTLACRCPFPPAGEPDWCHAAVLAHIAATHEVCRLTCRSEQAAKAVALEADRPGTHRAVAYGRYVFISYFDKRYPMDVAGWAFEHGHAADDAASAVIAGL